MGDIVAVIFRKYRLPQYNNNNRGGGGARGGGEGEGVTVITVIICNYPGQYHSVWWNRLWKWTIWDLPLTSLVTLNKTLLCALCSEFITWVSEFFPPRTVVNLKHIQNIQKIPRAWCWLPPRWDASFLLRAELEPAFSANTSTAPAGHSVRVRDHGGQASDVSRPSFLMDSS